jgi:hypothetical protein
LKHPDADPDHGYPGLADDLARYRSLSVPPCCHCGSHSVKKVETGIIGRTVTLAALTGKIRLVTGTKHGAFYCDACESYFGTPKGKSTSTPDFQHLSNECWPLS